ncbi:spore germination protein [Bacillus sp. Au-Bac7]|uniref:spore germination protein n=1 Tax=Bacillus sp. Au-Bac7 TaxID=2906458 RepID=UPI001E5F3EA0|nr:spore germination protein [Bacillus sp. Au-Bac7]MCE4052196.1 spore germination protein [Bacillus sp. Au-Bac7]
MKDTLKRSIQENTDIIKQKFNNTADLKFREITIGTDNDNRLCVVYLDGIIDTNFLQESVIEPIIRASFNNRLMEDNVINYVSNSILTIASVKQLKSITEAVDGIIQGNAVLLFDGNLVAIMVDVTKWAERSLEEALGERSLRGIVLGFSEKAKTNINVLRGIIKTEQLCVDKMTFGTIAKSDVYLLFIKGVVDSGVLQEVRDRLHNTDVKYILEARIFEDILEGKQKTIFPIVKPTDRPDIAASALFEGRVLVVVDGTPQVIIAPSLFVEYLQSPGDYYLKYGRFLNRFIRFFAFLSSIFLPGIYLALDKYAKENFPNKLYETLITKDELLPTIWEILILNILLRIFFDAVLRIPKSTVLIISLLGSILLGETAVSAKLIHPISLLIIGISFISAALLANKGLGSAIDPLRFVFIFLGYFFGFNGLIIGMTILVLHLTSLKSIGVPYLSPLIPLRINELKDVVYRGDLKTLLNSKHSFHEENKRE